MKFVIVESPTKAKTITKFLTDDYVVESSFGHVRDLPKSKMGVDPEKNFEPVYEVPKKAKERVAELRALAKKADEIYLATDEDREGEAISWHLYEILNIKDKPVYRIAFHEITRDAIHKALAAPRELDMNAVNAQQARRVVDRLVGYELSPFLWQKVQYGLSAGRVQSVAVRLIVERERERDAFKRDEYWTIDGMFAKQGDSDGIEFPGKLHVVDGKKLEKLEIANEEQAQQIMNDLQGAAYTIGEVSKKEVSKKPPRPLTTSRLQIEANNKLGFSARQTMTVAQKLYETGKITYMRTDSENLAEKFLGEAQTFLKATYGEEYSIGAQRYTTSAKGAQEAHEAIRPTDVTVTPENFKSRDEGQKKLYELIWRRTVATQMPAARVERTSVDVNAKQYTFRANGSSILFDGFMKVYRSAQEKILPTLATGDAVDAKEIKPEQHFTEPPARYSDATLVKTLEEYGIGRPSTYAPTISTIINRGYIDRDDNKKLYPLDIAYIVNDLLVEHFDAIVNYEFTAQMESDLDDVEAGTQEWQTLVSRFYGPFHENLTKKDAELNKEDVMKERVVGTDPETGLPVIVRNGRFGPFVQLGEWSEEDKKAKKNKPRSASLLKGQSIDKLTLEDAMYLLILPRVVGTDHHGNDIVADEGRFGPYLKAGEISQSLLNTDYDLRTIPLEDAQALIKAAEDRKIKMETPIQILGPDAKSGHTIEVRHGRYGPYVTDGETNASITKKSGYDPEKITQKEAEELLEKKRKAPKRNWGGGKR